VFPVDNGRWTALEALAEPRRRAVFAFASAAGEAVSRDDVAAAVGMSRPLAAHHLDRLVDAGLLVVTFARPPGRRGPGAGRPAKRYSPARTETAISVPPRRYDLAARIFARALTAGAQTAGTDPAGAVAVVAADEGRAEGRVHAGTRALGVDATLAGAARVLDELGYTPERTRRCVRLRNCPFHGILDVAPELMCGANHAFVTGLLAGLGGSPRVGAVLDPQPGPECCVRLEAASP
jgi:predicted ArsR family transcriptional regulator